MHYLIRPAFKITTGRRRAKLKLLVCILFATVHISDCWLLSRRKASLDLSPTESLILLCGNIIKVKCVHPWRSPEQRRFKRATLRVFTVVKYENDVKDVKHELAELLLAYRIEGQVVPGRFCSLSAGRSSVFGGNGERRFIHRKRRPELNL